MVCTACGKDFSDHLGVEGTCNQLQYALQVLDDIATGNGIINYNVYARMAVEHIKKAYCENDSAQKAEK